MRRFAGIWMTAAAAAALVVAIATAVAAPAQAAPKGVVGYFGNPTEFNSSLAGQFSTVRGVAVNGNPASPYFGDVYVADQGNHRIQRFSSLGAFELAWGRDVIKTDPDVNADLGTVFERCTYPLDCKAGVSGSLGGELATPHGIAVDQATGTVYVTEGGPAAGAGARVQAFTGDGQFIWASGKDVVASGGTGDQPVPNLNEVQTVTLRDPRSNGTPQFVTGGNFTLTFDGQTTAPPIAHNASAAAVDAALESLSSVGADNVSVTGSLAAGWTVTFVGALAGIDVAQLTGDGSALTSPFGPGSKVDVVTATAGGPGPGPSEICSVAAECKRGEVGAHGGEFGAAGGSSSSGGGNGIAVSPVVNPVTGAGNVVVTDRANRRVQELTSTGGFVETFGWDTVVNGSPSDPGSDTGFQICTVAADCKAAVAGGSGVGQFGANAPNRVAVDSTGAIYTVESSSNFRVQKFTPAGTNLVPVVVNPNIGGGGPALNLSGTDSFSTPSDVAVGVGDHVSVLRAFPATFGTPPAAVNERRVVELDSGGALVETHAALGGVNGAIHLAVNADSGQVYLTAAPSEQGSPQGVYVLDLPPPPPAVSLGVGAIGSRSAQLNGLVDPNGPGTAIGISTRYRFEYRQVGAPGWIALSADKDAGNGFAAVPVIEALDGLEADTEYEARLVASRRFSGLGDIVTAPEQFRTQASRPDIDSVYVTGRGQTTATLNARINPNGEQTAYRFEYGPTAAYGTTVPVPDGNAGAGTSTAIFSAALAGLSPATTYHFRVTATSANGANTSFDRTFTTRAAAPPPEGRAFELVSPPDKVGGTGLGPWYAGVGSHGPSGIGAYDGDRYASMAYYGGSLADGGFSYGADWTLGQRTAAGWVNRPAFNRPGGLGLTEFAKVPAISDASDDLALTAWSANSQLSIFAEQAQAWAGGSPGPGEAQGAALREWESGRWEIAAPLDPSQQVGAEVSTAVAADGGHALIGGLVRGVAGPEDPTSLDFGATFSRNVYIDDVTAGLSDSFPGTGIRSLVNVCTDAGGRTAIPVVDGGKIGAGRCPDALAGRSARPISPRGASVAIGGKTPGHISDDGSRVFFMSPDHLNADNDAACVGEGVAATKCPPQLYVRQRNQDGSVTTRWISESAVPDQDAGLMAAAVFEGATPDGDKAFFRTTSPLTADDPNGGAQQPGGVKTGGADPASADLYMYDFPDAAGADPGDGTLTRISAGPTGISDANVSTDAVGTNAGALRAIGDDGTRAYFVTAAPLVGVPAPAGGTITSPGGAKSQSATRNLYAYDATRSLEARWRFVAQLPANSTLGTCAAKGARPGAGLQAGSNGTGLLGGVTTSSANASCVQATGDGSLVVFFTDGRLTGDDPDSASGDVYAYDSTVDELTRVSAPQGAAGGASFECVTEGTGAGTRCHGDLGVPGQGGSSASLTLNLVTGSTGPSDRTLFFESASRLVPEDQNDVYDVYQWRNGTLSLLSTGAAGAEPALYRGSDRTGTNVYVSTRDRLTWQDHDSVLDVYVARAGSAGIPQPDPPPACALLADGCQGGGSAPVSAPATQTTSPAPADRGNAEAGVRRTLAVGALSPRARRAAARRGVLRLAVRTNRAGRISGVARARVGGRVRRVARGSTRVRSAGRAVLRLRLNRVARRRLGAGRSLRLAVRVTAPGARARAMTVRLPGGRS